ncbi:MAG: TIGR01777 family protein [Crocinitomicaceae bacterium]|jgi:uncharacterized protein (TIGR01777 family)|nr:TIGR01777 family protein [Crocinitomicaceae bacterium]|tara:strand:- start:605 stop:1585 length:981 start_codon:yes stop_codon:yes gene_type:complete
MEYTIFSNLLYKQLTARLCCCIMVQKSIVITGGTGLIGQEAIQFFSEQGYTLRILSRAQQFSELKSVQYFQWNPSNQLIPDEALRGAHAIVHLAGAPIAERWTAAYKQIIIESRVKTADVLLKAIKRLPDSDRPKIIVGASAVGWYPSSNELQSESVERAAGFIGDVTEAWENALNGFETIGMRTVSLRIGLVLSPHGGFLSRLKPIFNLGLGSAIGDGKHWQSWIHIEDVVRLFHWTISNDSCSGLYNATSPEPVTNLAMSRTLARGMKRPFWAPNVPEFALRLLFGKMSSILVASHRMDASRIEASGFEFNYPTLEEALLNVLR